MIDPAMIEYLGGHYHAPAGKALPSISLSLIARLGGAGQIDGNNKRCTNRRTARTTKRWKP